MDKLLFNDLVMVYKCLKNITPGYLHGRFHHSAKTNQRDTRQNNVYNVCNVCMYVCVCECMYVCMCVCVCVCVSMYVCNWDNLCQ